MSPLQELPLSLSTQHYFRPASRLLTDSCNKLLNPGSLVPHCCHGDHAKAQSRSPLPPKLKCLPGFSFTSGQTSVGGALLDEASAAFLAPPATASCPTFQESWIPGVSRKCKQHFQPERCKLCSNGPSSVKLP